MGAARHGVVWRRTHALLLHRQMASSQCKTVAMSNLKCRKYQLYLSWVGHDLLLKKTQTLLKAHRINFFYRQNSDKRHVRAHIIYQFYFHLLDNIMYVCMCVCRFQNVVLRCPIPRLHCFLSSHWPSFRFLSFMAFLIPSNQFFFGLPRALFCFGIHFNAIFG